MGVSFAADVNSTDSLHVDDSQDALTVDGDSFKDVQDAVNDADENSILYLNGNTYIGNGTQITVSKSITIDGASENGGQRATLNANHSSRVFYSYGANVILKNLILENGYNAYGALVSYGNGNLTLINCAIKDVNFITNSDFYGFLYSGSNSKLTLRNVDIFNNTINTYLKNVYGGGIYVRTNSYVLLENVNFYNNIIRSNSVNGGLIYGETRSKVDSSNIKCYNNSIISVSTYGGLIYSGTRSTVDSSHVMCYNNSVYSTGSLYGGVCYIDNVSTINMSNIDYYENIINAGYIEGALISIRISCNVEMSNLKEYDNSISSKNRIYGGLMLLSSSSKFNISNFECYNNSINSIGDINGGIIYLYQTAQGTIDNFKLYDNSINSMGRIYGGVMQLSYPRSSNFYNFECYNNSIKSTYDLFGGGIYLYQSTQGSRQNYKLDNINLYNNSFICTNLNGGGIYSRSIYGSLNLDNFNVFNNKVDASLDCAGLAFYLSSGSTGDTLNFTDLKLFDNIIYSNHAYGAVLSLSGRVINMKNGAVNNNKVFVNDDSYPDTYSQGMVQLEGTGQMNNISFDSNYLSSGLGVALQLAPVSSTYLVENCNFTNNLCGAALNESNRTYFMDHGGAICINGDHRGSVILRSCLFESNVNSQGGAITPHGNAIIENCRFINNVATKFCGGAISTDDRIGSNSVHITLKDCYFEGNSAPIGGAVQAKGDHVNIISNCTFKSNSAVQGGALYIEGNKSTVSDCIFIDNNATRDLNPKVDLILYGSIHVHGGALYSIGRDTKILNSEFNYNNAVPDEKNIEEGLGGAVYINGSSNEISDSVFNYNTARNGSAIYNEGVNFTVVHSNFNYNQAFSYRLDVSVTPVFSNYAKNNKIVINVTHIGGDNIINAIYNNGACSDVFFLNVTYDHSTGEGGKRNSGLVKVSPVASADLSENGKLVYQDPREDSQIIDLIIAREVDSGLLGASEISGKIIDEFHGSTGLYGNISFTLTGDLKPGIYNVYASHPGDRLYKSIENTTRFEIAPQVDLSIDKSSDSDSYFVGDIATFTITVNSLGTDAHNATINEILPDGLEIVDYTATSGVFSDNVWTIPLIKQETSEKLTLKVRVTTNGTFNNIVDVTSSDEDINMSNNVANKTIVVNFIVDLELTKVSDVKSVKVGDKIVWIITVKHHGDINATGVNVTDTLPNSLKYISHSATKGDFDPENGVWNIGNLSENETVTLTITTEAVKAGKVTNAATLSLNEPERDSTNNNANFTVDVKDTDDGSDDSEPADDGSDDSKPADDNQGASTHEYDGESISDSSAKSIVSDNHATGNPILVVLLALMSICISTRRKF